MKKLIQKGLLLLTNWAFYFKIPAMNVIVPSSLVLYAFADKFFRGE